MGSKSVSVIDTATNTVTSTVTVETGANGIAANPDGTKVYLSNEYTNKVSVIDTATNNVTATVNVGFQPIGVAITQDGTKVYVVNSGSNSVSIIDAATNKVTATVNVGESPIALGQFIGHFPAKPVLPIAVFSESPIFGKAPLIARFNNKSTESPNSWSWKFGDGNISKSQNSVHKYTKVGRYKVSLKVKNADGSNDKPVSNYITVKNK
jgi:YVTN family beta-propeller protein